MSKSSMFQGESRNRLLTGAAVGIIATLITGFAFLDWKLSSASEAMSRDSAKTAVAAALAPICAEKIQGLTDLATHKKELEDLTFYQRAGYIEKGGWSVFAGSDKAVEGVAVSCAQLIVDLK